MRPISMRTISESDTQKSIENVYSPPPKTPPFFRPFTNSDQYSVLDRSSDLFYSK